MNGLINDAKMTRVISATVAGTTAINGTVIDMQNQRSAQFTAGFGTITSTAVTSLKLQQGTLPDGSDMADLAGTSVAVPDSSSNKIASIEIVKPVQRYLRLVILRGTANAVVDFGMCTQFGESKVPVTHDASTVVATKQVISPGAGTP